MRLKDRVAIVTGGSSGIGRGVCLALAREGAKVVVTDLQEDPRRGKYHETDTSTPTVHEITQAGGEALFVRADVTREPDLRNLLNQAFGRYGKLDILVNNAGFYTPGNTEQLKIEDWDRMIAVHLRAVFLLTRLAIPYLRRSRHGRIVHISSIHAFGGGAGPAYAPAKAAQLTMAKDQALELGRSGITVNAICPGYIETAIQDYLTPEQIQTCRERTPLPRLGRPSDIANAVVFLASDDAEWITGTSLTVDGGFTAPV
jgi:NAD(P)-dependent dehydrogenase (short-subunit alcohol dehydrogenase family)